MKKVRMTLIDLILKGEREQANILLNDYAVLRSYHLAMNKIQEPILEEIGNKLAKESISLAQGYVARKIAEDMLLKIYEEEKGTTDKLANKEPVIVGNIENDYQSLGRRLVSVFLQSAGWIVFDLGNDVTAKEFVDKAVKTGALIS